MKNIFDSKILTKAFSASFVFVLLLLILTQAASFTSSETNPPTNATIVQAGAANQLFIFRHGKHIYD